jgi:NhaP-type Na+/H+ or K+/H+ antiporter
MYTHPVLETGMLLLYAYSSYLFAQGLGLSGIVSILFCGIVMAHYTRKNVSHATRELSIELCELVAFMAETFVFAYLGLSIFSLYTIYDWSFTLFAIVCTTNTNTTNTNTNTYLTCSIGQSDYLPID